MESQKLSSQSDKRFRHLFAVAPDGITILDRRGLIVECNEAAARLYGLSVEDVVGRHITDFVAPPFKDIFQKIASQLQQNKIQEREVQIVRADGRTREVWRRGAPLMDAEGNLEYILVYDRDITAMRQAKAELRKLWQAVEQSASTVVITDLNGTIEYVNPAFTRITGYSPEEAIGKNPRILKSGYHSPEFYQEMWTTLHKGEVWQGELVNKRKDGSLYWERATISPVKNENGKTTHYVAVKEDVTERKRIEQELRIQHQQEEILNKLLQIGLEDMSLDEQLGSILQEVLSISWLPLQPRGGIFLVEDEGETLVLKVHQGLSPSLQTMCALVPFGRCLCGQAAVARQILFADCVDERHHNQYEGMQPHGHYNVPIVSGEEVLGVIVLYLSEGHQKNDDEIAFLNTVANTLAGIIKRKRGEEALAQARDQAMVASQLKSQILAAVNHDLRNPLGAILGYVEFLQDDRYGSLSDRQQEVISKIFRNIQYLRTLVEDLLEASHLETGQMELHIASFNLRETIYQIEDNLRGLAQKKGLTLSIDITPDMPVTLSGDKKQVQRILVNLVDNAIKFTQKGGVRVRIYRSDSTHWAIDVLDTGSGIPPDKQADIFEAFQKINSELTQKHSGLGLGLFIVKQLVETMGGQIIVQSEEGQGSIFTIVLPLTPIKEGVV